MKYAVTCCDPQKPLAVLNVRRSQSGSVRVAVESIANTPHIRIVTNPVVEGKPTWDADELAKHAHADSAEQSVTEIEWGGHRSWVIRCGRDCPTHQEAMIAEKNLPKIAEKLATGNWQESIEEMPVVPLGVLSYLTDPRRL